MKYYFCLFFILLYGITSAETFHSKLYDFNISVPTDWQTETTKHNKSIIITHPELTATINITAYRLKKAVTANGLQKFRMGKHYDGWIYLLSRKGNNREINQSNVDDIYVSVYAKDIFDKNMISHQLLVGEYCFVTKNYSYILNVKTIQKHWSIVKPIFQSILNSFWIGDKSKKAIQSKKHLTETLPMSFYNVQNNNFINASPNIQKILEEKGKWKFNKSKKVAIYPVIANDIVVIAQDKRIVAISLSNLSIQWEFKSNYLINTHLIAHNHLVSLIRYNDGPELISLDLYTGEIVNKKKLQPPISAPFLHDNMIFIITNHHLISLDAISKKILWKKRLSLNLLVQPVVSNEKLILVNQSGEIIAVNPKTGKPSWSFKKAKLTQQSLIATGYHLIWVELDSLGNSIVNVLNTENGKILWKSDAIKGTATNIPSADNQQIYIIMKNQNHTSKLHALDLKNGNLNWTITTGKITNSHRPIVLSNAIILISDNQYWVIDKITGTFYKSASEKKELIDHFFYKNWILKWQKQKNNYIFSASK